MKFLGSGYPFGQETVVLDFASHLDDPGIYLNIHLL